jgi:hypothetical protein
MSEKDSPAVSVGVLGALSIPAIVWGFASTVGTVAVTGRNITYMDSIGNPARIGAFGFVSEELAKIVTTRKRSVPVPVIEAVPE